MCKFCENLEMGEYTNITSIENNLGVLGNMTTSIGVWSEEDGSFTMTTMVSGVFDVVEEATIKIKYCPMCGKKLETSQGE